MGQIFHDNCVMSISFGNVPNICVFEGTQPKRQLPFSDLSCRSDWPKIWKLYIFQNRQQAFSNLHVCHLCWCFTKADQPGMCLHKKQVSKLSKNWHICIIWISSKLGIHLKKTMAFLVTTPLKHHSKSTTCTFPFYIFVLYLPRFLLSSFSDCL